MFVASLGNSSDWIPALKKLVIHMGAHRCGSTAIQSALRREQQQLADNGIGITLRADMVGGGLDLRRLHRYHTINPVWQKKLRDIASALDNSKYDMLVASEENLMGTMPGVRGSGFYPHFHRFVSGVNRLQSIVGDAFFIAPRLVIRRQDKYLESVYAFRVSRGLDQGFERFLKSVPARKVSWLRLAEHLRSLPDTTDPQVALLEAWPKGSAASLAIKFLVGDNNLEPSVRRLTGNTRHSATALRLILAFNKAKIRWQDEPWRQDVFDLAEIYKDDQDADISFAVKGRLSDKEFKRFTKNYSPTAKLGFDAEERQRFLASFAEENRRLLSLSIVSSPKDAWDFEA